MITKHIRIHCWLAATMLLCSTAHAVADELTRARVAELTEPQRSQWQAYLKRSSELAQADAGALANEVKSQGFAQALKAPNGGDFKLEHKSGDAWYASHEAAELAKVILSYQAPNGGWSKHVGYSQGPRRVATQWTSQSDPGKRPHYLATFDNRSTTEQLVFLSNVTQTSMLEPCRAGFRKGLRFILDAQYPNGGWPQVFPLEGGYHDNITFNDDATVHILELLLVIRTDADRFGFLDAQEREQAQLAFQRGVECVLKAQVMQRDRKTAWCAQHDPLTLKPAGARTLEPASLSGNESARVLALLMRLEKPAPEVIASIEAGLRWLEEVQITGYERVKLDGKTTYRLKPDSKEVYWARFYDPESNRPIFPGRDGKIYSTYPEMAANNHVGYDYLSTQPGSILKNAQKKWRNQLNSK